MGTTKIQLLGNTDRDVSKPTIPSANQFVQSIDVLYDVKIPVDLNDDTLSHAIKLIDPEGLLLPGSRQYGSIRLMLQTWLDQYGPVETLEMARGSAKFLMTWWKIL